MHACGHDGHMANLLTFAQWLSEHRASLRDDVVLLFQPARQKRMSFLFEQTQLRF